MVEAFLCGVLVAAAMAQVALGVFFALAFWSVRREAEYLLFSLLCLALAITTVGIAYSYAVQPGEAARAATVTHVGAIAAASINLHFVLRYAGLASLRRFVPAAYALTAAYEVALLLDLWWVPGSLTLVGAEVFGRNILHLEGSPTLVASTFYAFATAQLLLTLVLLGRAYRAGKREAGWSLAGCIVVGVAATNDMLLVIGWLETLYVLPYGFLVYAFAVSITLLYRHRLATGQLEETTTVLEEKTEQLRHSYAELEVLQDQLVHKQQLAQVGELAAAIAHEVRNPLAIIMNAVAGLRRKGLGDQDRQMLLGIVDEEAARLNRLVTDLLRFARPVNVRSSGVSLVELAKRARAAMPDRYSLELRLEGQGDADLPNVWADPSLVKVVFDNLVENACQSMPEGGVVNVRLCSGVLDGRACLRADIRDSGQGMDAETLGRATDPFFTTRPSGTGLGLPIVQRIVEAHRGKLELASRLGEGTIATVWLPIHGSTEGERRS
jgi:signal transduction histidine kinase